MMAHFAIRGLMHEAALKPTKIRIACRFSTLSAWCPGKSRTSRPFPPSGIKAFHGTVRMELLEERVLMPLMPSQRALGPAAKCEFMSAQAPSEQYWG